LAVEPAPAKLRFTLRVEVNVSAILFENLDERY
jgi:hypothetical protein